jgi:hypothetical protein
MAEPQTAACCAGDRAGYLRHRWHGEEPCAASRAANTAYCRRYRSAHRAYFRHYRKRRATTPTS